MDELVYKKGSINKVRLDRMSLEFEKELDNLRAEFDAFDFTKRSGTEFSFLTQQIFKIEAKLEVLGTVIGLLE